MITFLTAVSGGLVSAVIALVLGQPLQHYFWRRQRQAERQLAVIDQLTTLTAELQFLLLHQPEGMSSRREQLATVLYRVATSTASLFSTTAYDRFSPALKAMENILRMSTPFPPEHSIPLHNQLLFAAVDALDAFYKDMGIPPRRPWRRLGEHVGQLCRVQGSDHLLRSLRSWHERGWPMLQRWGAQARTRWRR